MIGIGRGGCLTGHTSPMENALELLEIKITWERSPDRKTHLSQNTATLPLLGCNVVDVTHLEGQVVQLAGNIETGHVGVVAGIILVLDGILVGCPHKRDADGECAVVTELYAQTATQLEPCGDGPRFLINGNLRHTEKKTFPLIAFEADHPGAMEFVSRCQGTAAFQRCLEFQSRIK